MSINEWFECCDQHCQCLGDNCTTDCECYAAAALHEQREEEREDDRRHGL